MTRAMKNKQLSACKRILRNAKRKHPDVHTIHYAHILEEPDGNKRQAMCDDYRFVVIAEPFEELEIAPKEYSEYPKAYYDTSNYVDKCNTPLDLPSEEYLKGQIKDNRAIDKGTISFYDFGKKLPLVNSQYLLDMIQAIPKAKAFAQGDEAIYFTNGVDVGVLLPVRRKA